MAKLQWIGNATLQEAQLNCANLTAYKSEGHGKKFWYRINGTRDVGPYNTMLEAMNEAESHILTRLEDDVARFS